MHKPLLMATFSANKDSLLNLPILFKILGLLNPNQIDMGNLYDRKGNLVVNRGMG